jgi:hypothetical protein
VQRLSTSCQPSDEAFRTLRESELPFPTLSEALEMLGLDKSESEEAARTLQQWRESQDGATVRGDVV